IADRAGEAVYPGDHEHVAAVQRRQQGCEGCPALPARAAALLLVDHIGAGAVERFALNGQILVGRADPRIAVDHAPVPVRPIPSVISASRRTAAARDGGTCCWPRHLSTAVRNSAWQRIPTRRPVPELFGRPRLRFFAIYYCPLIHTFMLS